MIEELYTVFREELLRYCQTMAQDHAAAEDLVQETYMRAMTHLEDLEDLNRGQRRSWLYKTARNLYIDRTRKLSRETPEAEETMPQAAFEEDFGEIAVQQMVGRLPESERALFILRYFQGYNASELGEVFRLPASTVRARLASARRKLLRWYLDNY